uniref:Uncharacterized protein n=1 Tax=Aegilops tauschii TaxID=37682 RepID=M8BT43_AEGTA
MAVADSVVWEEDTREGDEPLPGSLCHPKMVRLGAVLTAERVLSTEHSSSTQALIRNAGEDTTSSEPIITTTHRSSMAHVTGLGHDGRTR